MHSSPRLRRVMFAHQWHSVQEWAEGLDALADLTDDEIDDMLLIDAVAAGDAATAEVGVAA